MRSKKLKLPNSALLLASSAFALLRCALAVREAVSLTASLGPRIRTVSFSCSPLGGFFETVTGPLWNPIATPSGDSDLKQKSYQPSPAGARKHQILSAARFFADVDLAPAYRLADA